MSGIWCMRGYRHETGHCQFEDTALVYLYILPHLWVPYYHIYGACLLDEHQAVCFICQTQSAEVFRLKKCIISDV